MIKKLINEIIASIKNRKINVFFLFLLLAFVILIFTKLSKEYTNTITFGIDKVNVPKDIVVLNDSNNTLRVTLKTHGFKWLSYYFSEPKIRLDFSKDLKKTKSGFIWNKSKAFIFTKEKFGDNVELFSISPDTLVFRYDVNLVKKIPVLLNADVNFASGFDLASGYNIKPDSIIVIGPEIIASKINFVQTQTFRLKNVKSDISQTIKLKLPKSEKNLTFSLSEVTIFAKVEKFTEGILKIPVVVTNIPEGMTLNYFPKTVNVTYYTSLNNFNAIKEKDFAVECDYSSLENGQVFLTPKLTKIPKLVKSAKVSQQPIEFIILE
jgi:YbbR-like protein